MRIAPIVLLFATATFAAPPPFKPQEIDTSLKVGYAVTTADLNRDGKPDIVVVDTARVIWFENPTWKLHTITQGQTKTDNVCLAIHDIDGDGKLDIALGAGWRPPNSTDPGTIQWLQQPADIDTPWPLHPIGEEPTVHRMRFADLDGSGKPQLIVAPLQGAGSTPQKNWSETGVRLLSFKIPADPVHGPWTPQVLDSSMHALHNFHPVDFDGDGRLALLTASYEGVGLLQRSPDGKWSRQSLHQGNQDHPNSNRGSSEIKLGKLPNGKPFIATIEPWHGNQTVVYTQGPDRSWQRKVIDQNLKWGHAVSVADLDNSGHDTLIIGVRDPLNDRIRSGINLFTPSADGSEWTKTVLDNGTVAVEDLTAADLNGDGRIDLIAVGRATHNVKIFWNAAQ